MIRIASSKLPPSHERKAIVAFWPIANSPLTVDEESAITSPFMDALAFGHIGRWSMQVLWFERWYFLS
jgi:hypothetical protein